MRSIVQEFQGILSILWGSWAVLSFRLRDYTSKRGRPGENQQILAAHFVELREQKRLAVRPNGHPLEWQPYHRSHCIYLGCVKAQKLDGRLPIGARCRNEIDPILDERKRRIEHRREDLAVRAAVHWHLPKAFCRGSFCVVDTVAVG